MLLGVRTHGPVGAGSRGPGNREIIWPARNVTVCYIPQSSGKGAAYATLFCLIYQDYMLFIKVAQPFSV